MDGWTTREIDGFMDDVKVESDNRCLNLALTEFLAVLQIKSQLVPS